MLYLTTILCLSWTIFSCSSEFLVTSTPSPGETPNLTCVLSRLEEKLDYQNILRETHQTLKSLETKLQHGLESLHIQLNRIEKKFEKSLPSRIPTDCSAIHNKSSGIYLIHPEFAPRPFPVLCDMETKGGGWTYFFNRFDGSQDFYLNWTDYKNGFGKLTGEFWLGLENLYHLTGFESNELLVQLTDWENNTVYALYNAFMVGSEEEGYPLKVLGAYSGNAGDSLHPHEGLKFTTQDRDQDLRSYANCALAEKGSWWYHSCTTTNPTARYLKGEVSSADKWQIMYWDSFRGPSYSLKEARMMVRPMNSFVRS